MMYVAKSSVPSNQLERPSRLMRLATVTAIATAITSKGLKFKMATGHYSNEENL